MQDCLPALSWIYFLFSSCPLLLQYNMPDFPCHLYAWWSACPIQLSACPYYCYLAISLLFATPCLSSPILFHPVSLLVLCYSLPVGRLMYCFMSFLPVLSYCFLLSDCLAVLWFSLPVGFTYVLLLELSDCPLSWNLNEICLSCPVVSCLSPCSFLLSALYGHLN